MSGPVPVSGLFEAHLAVGDVGRSIAFYRDVVGLTPALEQPERGAAFLWIGRPGEAMLGLWSLGSAPLGVTSHVAFAATLEDVLGACERLRSLGVTPLSFDTAETEEPSVIGWMPAAAVYFRDPDGHLLEYLSMLPSEPAGEAGIVTWSEWNARTPATGSLDDDAVRIAVHVGPREELRALFSMAEDSDAELDSYIDAGGVLVAVAGGQVVGQLQLVDGDLEHSEIKNMAVEPSHRRRGVGSALIRAAVELTRAQDRPRLLVATAAADVDNLRFYQQAGFRLRSIERDAFTPDAGYAPDTKVDGIPLRDRVVLDLDLTQPDRGPGAGRRDGARAAGVLQSVRETGADA